MKKDAMVSTTRGVPPSGVNPGLPRFASRYSAAVVWAVAALLAYRFYWVISKYAVNLFFFDEWDIYEGLFDGSSSWQMFLQQHGPHRQGLGVPIVAWLLRESNWDSRVQAFAIGTAIVLAMALAIRLKTIVYGRLWFFDIVIPVIFLGLGQWEVLLSAPGPSAQAFPLLLLIAYGWAWVQPRESIRYTAIVVLNFLLVYTGYGIFVAAITLTLLGLDCYHRVKSGNGSLIAPCLAWIASAASLGAFFYDYTFNPAAGCYHFPYQNPAAYLWFMGLMFAKFLGIKHGVVWPALLGIAALIVLMVVLARNFWIVLQRGTAEHGSLLVVILTTYTLIYAGAAAIGRVCLGMQAAGSSRNLTLLIPGFLGLYFHVLMHRTGYGRTILVAAVLAAVLPSCIQRNHKEIEAISATKHAWKDCYRAIENIQHCDDLSNLQLYPWPEAIQLQQKLNYLKQKRLNLYANEH